MKSIFLFVACLAAATVKLFPTRNPESPFVVKPYLQIGSANAGLRVHWQTVVPAGQWSISYRCQGQSIWNEVAAIDTVLLRPPNARPVILYNASLAPLAAGLPFEYRLTRNGQQQFIARGIAPKTAAQPFRFVATGDLGAGTKESIGIARGVAAAKPDLVTIAGDIIYDRGLVSEYATRWWPIYNADSGSATGAPLLRSIPFVAAVGNHDADTRDLDKYPDALAYFLFWDQPLNGPLYPEGSSLVPVLKGSEQNIAAFRQAAGKKYPRMTNFSFDYGNAHWTVLDADVYVDWRDTSLQSWVRKDLAASTATWKFVLFHHPGFNSSREHFEQQQMRLLAPVFEQTKVDIVFTGHVHNYQRSYPLRFTPDDNGSLLMSGKQDHTPHGRVVNGRWILDKQFDGNSNKRPTGVIYIVSGAGGQDLYNPEQEDDKDSWQPFTCRFVSKLHSFTVVDISGPQLQLKQQAIDGRIVDSIEIRK